MQSSLVDVSVPLTYWLGEACLQLGEIQIAHSNYGAFDNIVIVISVKSNNIIVGYIIYTISAFDDIK